MRKIILIVIIFLTGFGFVYGEADTQQILAELDEMSSFAEKDYSCVMTVVTEKPKEERNIQQARVYRRDRTDSAVILIEKPVIQKGQGYLMITENLWFYDPESRKFAHTSVKDNFQDSDAKNSDFRPPNYQKDYSITNTSAGKLGDFEVWILSLEARHEEVPYPSLRIWVRKDNILLLKTESYGLSKRLMRTVYYPQYRKIGDTFIAVKMLFIDELRPGEKTQVTVKEPSLSSIPDDLFTKSFIERASR